MLFEDDGTTFTEFTVKHRLARARRQLSGRRHTRRTVGAIAFDVGFGDHSRPRIVHDYLAPPPDLGPREPRPPGPCVPNPGEPSRRPGPMTGPPGCRGTAGLVVKGRTCGGL